MPPRPMVGKVCEYCVRINISVTWASILLGVFGYKDDDYVLNEGSEQPTTCDLQISSSIALF